MTYESAHRPISNIDDDTARDIYVSSDRPTADTIIEQLEEGDAASFRGALVRASEIRQLHGVAAADSFLEGVARQAFAYRRQEEINAFVGTLTSTAEPS